LTRFYGITRVGRVTTIWVRGRGRCTTYYSNLLDPIDQSKVGEIDRFVRCEAKAIGLEGSIEIEQYNGGSYYNLTLGGKFVDEDKPEEKLKGDAINRAIGQIARVVEEKFFPLQQRTAAWNRAVTEIIRGC